MSTYSETPQHFKNIQENKYEHYEQNQNQAKDGQVQRAPKSRVWLQYSQPFVINSNIYQNENQHFITRAYSQFVNNDNNLYGDSSQQFSNANNDKDEQKQRQDHVKQIKNQKSLYFNLPVNNQQEQNQNLQNSNFDKNLNPFQNNQNQQAEKQKLISQLQISDQNKATIQANISQITLNNHLKQEQIEQIQKQRKLLPKSNYQQRDLNINKRMSSVNQQKRKSKKQTKLKQDGSTCPLCTIM